MYRKSHILFLLCLATLLPSIAKAQFFTKQKVVVWNISDTNSNIAISEATKKIIHENIIEAFVHSVSYEAFECNPDDVIDYITTNNLNITPSNIIKTIGILYKVDFIIFTAIKTTQPSASYNDYFVHLSSELINVNTQERVRYADIDIKSRLDEIPDGCNRLLTQLLGEEEMIKEEAVKKEPPFMKVEIMPSFMGGDLNTFRAWFVNEFKIPYFAAENGIQGRVVMKFVIEKDGSIGDIEFLQSPHKVYEDEARRVLMKSPRWTPGIQRDREARICYTLPIDCRLQ